jgi:N-acetylmuramoyl-L-alanine amidase CwlA
MPNAPSPPYVGPAARHGASNNKPISRIVIHCTVSPCVPGGARNVARMFRTTTRPASAHYVVDPNEAVQVVFDSVVAYHAPPNQHALGIELCDMQSGPGSRWQDGNHKAMLARAAPLVAGLCAAYGVPMVKLSPADLKAGKRGICGHIDVSHAWGQTTHVDPEATPGFPWASFMDQIRAAARAPQEDEMQEADFTRIQKMVTAAAEAEGAKTRATIHSLIGDVVDSDPAVWGDAANNTKVKASTALARILDALGKGSGQQ